MKCGSIVESDRKIEIEDEMYANWTCDECGHTRLLYLCDNVDEIAIYKDWFLDERFFNYGKDNTKL